MHKPIYLAGPINGRSNSDATDWRAAAVALLAEATPGVPILDPMARDFRGRENLPGVDAEIVEGDKDDINRCGAVLLRWDGGGSAGTTMELLYASERGIPVHVWDDRPAEQRGRPLSPWVTYHAFSLDATLTEAVGSLRSRYGSSSELSDRLVKSGLGDLLLRYLGLDISAGRVARDGAYVTDPIDYPAVAERLGLRGTCTVHLVRPEEQDVKRPADNVDGALCVAISHTFGPYSNSPVRPILTATHRATGLCLSAAAGPWPATPAGLRRAKAAVKLLRGAPGFDWPAEDPTPADVPPADAIAALRELVGDLGEFDPPKPAKKTRA